MLYLYKIDNMWAVGRSPGSGNLLAYIISDVWQPEEAAGKWYVQGSSYSKDKKLKLKCGELT